MADAPSRPPGTVLVAQPSVELYGADRMAARSVSALVEAGWRVVVAVPTLGPLVGVLEGLGAEVRVVRSPVLRRAYLSPRGLVSYVGDVTGALPILLRQLADVAPDVVYANTITGPPWIAAARLRGVPVLCHVHEAEDRSPRPVRVALTAPLLAADLVVANSGATRDFLVRQHAALARRTTVVLNGSDGPATPVPPVRDRLTGRVRLVLVGRISQLKGTDVAVAAVGRLVRDGYDVELAVVGGVYPGKEWFLDELTASVDELGIADRVHWRGPAAEPWEALAEADIALVPSRVESFGLTAVEAMLAGRPLVAAATQGLVEVVEPERTGLLVDADDPEALAAGVGRVIDDWPSALERASTAGVEARSRFSAARYAREIVEVVGQTAFGDGAPAP